jgi:hypothetical protein
MPEVAALDRRAIARLPLLSSSETLERALAWLAAMPAFVEPHAHPSMVTWCARAASARPPPALPSSQAQAHLGGMPSMVSWCSRMPGTQAQNVQQGMSWLPVLPRQRVWGATPRMSSRTRESRGKTPRTAQLAAVEKRVEEALAQQIRSRPQTPVAPQDPARSAATAGGNSAASILQSPSVPSRFDCLDAFPAALSRLRN